MEFAGDWDGIARVVMEAAKRLEKSGAEGLIIACNTVHKGYDAIAGTSACR